MKTLYLECGMGAAGDMLMAALSELTDAEAFVEKMNSLGIPGVKVVRQDAVTCGIHGTHMQVTIDGEEEITEDVRLAAAEQGEMLTVSGEHHHDHEHEHEHHHDHDHEHEHHHDHEHEHEHHHDHDHEHEHHHDHDHDHEHEHHHDHDHEHEHHHDHDHEHHHHGHHHTSMADIRTIVAGLPVSEKVRQDVLAVYQLIAEAESHAHNCPVEEIHFHEVGNMDAVADITGVCLLMEMIGADQILCSPVHVGSGHVRCAHGILPVPAPATAYLLRGIPSYSGSINGELCTPTGAALLRHFVTRFVPMPVMATEKVGYGIGHKVFPAANCVRAFLGETENTGDRIVELSCNLDDVTGEDIGFASEQLMASGALDVFTTPVQMKKNRPGLLLNCLCHPEDAERMARLIFAHTTTIGIRRTEYNRYTLTRHEETLDTPYGPIRAKVSEGYGVRRCKAEYDDLAAAAKKAGVSIQQVRDAIKTNE